MDFKAGDKVRRIGGCGVTLPIGKICTVRSVSDSTTIYVEESVLAYCVYNFEKVEPSLETELRLCESRRDIVVGRVDTLKQEEKSLEERIQELQQAINERDKPKGRVGIKYPLDGEDIMYAVAGDGWITRVWLVATKEKYRTLGNLFFDRKSAERAVHDRKQRVLRGEDV